ncbi:LutC/YkgG family protein [Duganella qianjiadongensis]|uniref:Lactate utilization protein C n=1 Tax=Duganella qianjiadongensis TaxID=2692176 RepID=A0ABW9VSW0_9BURK|nr:lactate utilization protein C [Duganella qianjiadongensis]MYM42152.1 lactate utilization protein C [Duganella qianjiadongensis]
MSTMSARERILGKLRAAAPAPTHDAAALQQRIDEHYADGALRSASPSQLADRLQSIMASVRTDVWRADAASWPQLLADKLAEAGVQRLLLDHGSKEGAVLAAALPDSVQTQSFAQPIEQWKAELFNAVDAGFTVARSGIAATGTLIVVPDAGAPRTVSLVPPLHIALVYASTLYADMHAAARSEGWTKGMPTNLVMISGPSKTSDIQQTLAYGAHGPRALWLIIVDDAVEQGGAA